ncbi:MAG TPA: hypothetical protein VNT79_17820 [Phycisphaerae bacterium]|nr:hypothetical protein [Phycisphaerae bacterium]
MEIAKTITAVESDFLCSLAVQNGFKDCAKVRQANAEEEFVKTRPLRPGDAVKIPSVTPKEDTGQTELRHRFRRPGLPRPRVEFIEEQGFGYGVGTSPAGSAQPQRDRKRAKLGITNYVSDRGGDGTLVGNFPAATFHGHDRLGTVDPDHFKVQVHLSSPAPALDKVMVNLHALKPAYFKRDVAGKPVVMLHPTKWVRPSNAARRLENIECKRIPNTNFFRSPYLRLVSFQTSQAKRNRQTLLMLDYFDEGPANYQKHYTEIVHQKVEAVAEAPNCPAAANKCGVNAIIELPHDHTLHMAVHILQGTGVTEDEARRNIYTWTRRVLASAHIRPVIEKVHVVPEPKNMLIIAGGGSGATAGNAALRGRHASGKNASNKASEMAFTIDGAAVTYAPTARHSPSQTADGIMARIAATPALAGYTTRKFKSSFRNLAAAANQISDPFDVIVLKPDGKPAEVTNVRSNDRPVGGARGQTLDRVRNFTLNNFPVNSVAFGGASDEQRVLRWNYSVDQAINFYVVGNPILLHRNGAPSTTALDGFSPYGTNLGWVTDVGPSVYITINGVKTRMFVLAHEMFHPLMHNVHADAPHNDANAGTAIQQQSVECMNAGLLEVEAHDCTKHISDAPIAAQYEFLEAAAFPVAADGGAGPPARTTPVRRLMQIAGGYGIVRGGGSTPLDPVVTDLPAQPEP